MSFADIRPPEREVFQVGWPGTGREVGLMLLRCAEVQEAHFAAVDRFRRAVQPADGVGLSEFLREVERQQVFRMVLQPGSRRPEDRLFDSADAVRKALDLDEVAFFQREHERLSTERLQRLGMLPGPASESGERTEGQG